MSLQFDLSGILVRAQNATNETFHLHDPAGRSILLMLPPGELQPGDKKAFQGAKMTLVIEYDTTKEISLELK